MKKIMLTGGGLGFGLGTFCGLLTEGSSWPGILLRASVGALLTGLLWRWLAGVLARCLAQAEENRFSSPAPVKNTTAVSSRSP